VIARAVSRLPNNTRDARLALYDLAEIALTAKLLESPEVSDEQMAAQRLALEWTIRKIECEDAEGRTARQVARKATTALAILSILPLVLAAECLWPAPRERGLAAREFVIMKQDLLLLFESAVCIHEIAAKVSARARLRSLRVLCPGASSEGRAGALGRCAYVQIRVNMSA
jgi:hypothetical protein